MSQENIQLVFRSLRHEQLHAEQKLAVLETMNDLKIKNLEKDKRNASAVIVSALYDSLVLHIARVLDPMEQGKSNENLTFERLVFEIEHEIPVVEPQVDLARNISLRLEEICKFLEPIRVARNKAVAHKDYRVIDEPPGKPVTVKLSEIKRILQELGDILDTIENHLFGELHKYLEELGVTPLQERQRIIRMHVSIRQGAELLFANIEDR